MPDANFRELRKGEVLRIHLPRTNENYKPGNAGLPFYFDILLPLLLIVLLIIYRVSGEDQTQNEYLA